MKRREFITLLGGAAAWPLAGRAQQPAKARRIAIVHPFYPLSEMTATGPSQWRAFFDELTRAGYIEGQNLVVERYSAEGRVLADLARDVVRSNPDLIFAITGRMVLAFVAATKTIPIVAAMNDPVVAGIVSSLARPGGNVTGVTFDAGGLWDKRLEILREATPNLSKVGFLTTEDVWQSIFMPPTREAFRRAGVSLVGPPLVNPRSEAEYRRVFAAMTREGVDGLVVSDQADFWAMRKLIVALAAEARVPTIFPYRDFVDVGGLMGYTIDSSELYQQEAAQISRILKGASAAELPFYIATKVQLVLNLKAASALGLTFPPALLVRADEVIE
jgi:putative tryptophan/tyrosine transport system substrate-binding protein